ncbi:hypothetical protein BS17DRAFT_821856 [Gyrodon lividus]|nr:hypothetical protein BS17DRAFT_821856 [Gyrodon lividus]
MILPVKAPPPTNYPIFVYSPIPENSKTFIYHIATPYLSEKVLHKLCEITDQNRYDQYQTYLGVPALAAVAGYWQEILFHHDVTVRHSWTLQELQASVKQSNVYWTINQEEAPSYYLVNACGQSFDVATACAGYCHTASSRADDKFSDALSAGSAVTTFYFLLCVISSSAGHGKQSSLRSATTVDNSDSDDRAAAKVCLSPTTSTSPQPFHHTSDATFTGNRYTRSWHDTNYTCTPWSPTQSASHVTRTRTHCQWDCLMDHPTVRFLRVRVPSVSHFLHCAGSLVPPLSPHSMVAAFDKYPVKHFPFDCTRSIAVPDMVINGPWFLRPSPVISTFVLASNQMERETCPYLEWEFSVNLVTLVRTRFYQYGHPAVVIRMFEHSGWLMSVPAALRTKVDWTDIIQVNQYFYQLTIW